MFFIHNQGNQGGVFLLDSGSTLDDLESVYTKNYAVQGGVFFAINESQFNIKKG